MTGRKLCIGVDFDNTIVCYDGVFHQAAARRGLIPDGLPASKNAVRDYLRQRGQERLWTELQGLVYGPRLREAAPFPGALEFFIRCRRRRVPIYIISHKTRFAAGGPSYDLHRSARQWLRRQGLLDDRVFFELTKDAKLRRVAEAGCTYFIDDLPEFLQEAAFPAGVERILFDPNHHHPAARQYRRVASWPEVEKIVLTP